MAKANVCPRHGEKEWVECWNCEDGHSGHDCGEDTCCCADPEDNVRCDICAGKGGWYHCFTCQSETREVHGHFGSI